MSEVVLNETVEEEKGIEWDGVCKVETMSVDFEEKEVVVEKLVSCETEEEEISEKEVNGVEEEANEVKKVDALESEERKVDDVAEEEIVNSTSTESVHIDEPDGLTSAYDGDSELEPVETEDSPIAESSRLFPPRPNGSNIFPNLKVAMGEDISESNLSEEEKQKLENLQSLRVKYLRLVHRLGQSVDTSIAKHVLNRLALLHHGQKSSLDAAIKKAMESEAEGKDDLNFSLNMLVLGKSGVGKSATINSIFGDQKNASIDAFGPSTTSVREVSGTVGGVKITIIDTPGLKSSAMDQSANSKTLSAVKKAMKKCPPDVVLYVDRLDAQSRGLNNLLLLRTITSSLGPSIWENAVVTLTHSASHPPDGPSGTPLNYEVFVSQCSYIVQQSIRLAVGLMYSSPTTPVYLVENHPLCRKNKAGEKVLPNGQAWKTQLMLLCYSLKVLSHAFSLSIPQEPLNRTRVRSPSLSSILSLPKLLSWLLPSRAHLKLPADQGVDSDIEIDDVSDSEQEDEEYNQLPPFKPLRKTQLGKLSKEQRKAYFDEYDYRVKLLQKKQWKELRRMREMKRNRKRTVGESEYGYPEEEEDGPPPASSPVLVADMELPPSFDSDNSAYRYRSLEPTSQFLTRSLLDTKGWDHDSGFDCVIAEQSLAIAKRFPAAFTVQMTKDKKKFNIDLDSSVCAKHGDNGSTMAGLHIQGSEQQLMYVLRGETKFKNFRKKNKMTLGGSVTFIDRYIVTGLKLEDQITLGKRLVLVGNAGTTRSQGDSAYEGNLEVRFREADFPIAQNQHALGVSMTKSKDDLTLKANLRSQVSVGRQTSLSAFASIDNNRIGQLTIRTSSSDQLQIAFMAFLPIAMSIYHRVIRSGDT